MMDDKGIPNRRSIRPLKRWARENLPTDSALRRAIEEERDHLSLQELVAKAEVWNRLFPEVCK